MTNIDPTVIFFALFAILAVGSAFYAVVLARNIVRAAFALMGTFGGIAGLFGVLGADFLVAVQLIVYVGGILILILFAIMLSRRPSQGELPGSGPGLLGWAGVLVIAGLLVFVGFQVLASNPFGEREIVAALQPTTTSIGELFLTEFLLPFELISVLLLGALVGAVVLARKEVRP